MKLPNFLHNDALNGLRMQMGASELGQLTLVRSEARLTIAELEELVGGGIDLQDLNQIRALDDGTLAYKDRRVLLYIRDVPEYSRHADSAPRYHVANCRTLHKMREQDRMHRYVVAARQDGQFQVNVVRGGGDIRTSLKALNICQNCLEQLGFDGFSYSLGAASRAGIVSRFSPSRYFERYSRDLIDDDGHQTEEAAPLNDYTNDFAEHSRAAKERVDYHCQGCERDHGPPHLRRFLQTHHRNGIKYDNRPDNLLVVCLGCHANQPGHAHMRAHPDFNEFIRCTEG